MPGTTEDQKESFVADPRDDRRSMEVHWKAHVDRRLDEQNEMLKKLDDKLDAHTETTRPVVEAMANMNRGIVVIGWIGTKAAKVGAVGAAIISAYAGWKALGK